MKVAVLAGAVLIAGAAAGCDPAPSGDVTEPKNHGAEVSDVAHNTDSTGKNKGAAVSAVARNNHGHGNSHP
jgi:hypothetical protein